MGCRLALLFCHLGFGVSDLPWLWVAIQWLDVLPCLISRSHALHVEGFQVSLDGSFGVLIMVGDALVKGRDERWEVQEFGAEASRTQGTMPGASRGCTELACQPP